MARANHHHIAGQISHITRRSHKKEFLLKFATNRKRWLQWLFEANKHFGLDILKYTVTSNHIHLSAVDGDEEVLRKSLQLVAEKTAQEFNRRKDRKGAFWEDRYHATAIETGEHCLRCLVYIDLNMVRNRVVQHLSVRQHGGYNEIQDPPQRYFLINREKLIACCGLGSDAQLRQTHREWVEEAIIHDGSTRQPQWSESMAVGSKRLVLDVLQKLQVRAKGRTVREVGDRYELREARAAYNAHFTPENELLKD